MVLVLANQAIAGDKLVIGNVVGYAGDMDRYISIKVSNLKEVSLGFRLRYNPAVIQVTAIGSVTDRPNLLVLTNLNNRPFVPGNLSFGFADFSYNQLIEPGTLREVGRIYFNIPTNAREGNYIMKVGPLTGISTDSVMVYRDGALARPDVFDGQLIITNEAKLKILTQ